MQTQIIDVHSHIYPSTYVDFLAKRSEIPLIDRRSGSRTFVIFPGETGRPMGEEYSDPERKLAYMDEVGIDRSVVCVGNPWLDPIAADQSVGLADEINGELAALENQTSGRIVCLGVLPSGPPSAAVTAVEAIAGRNGLHGVVVGSRICGRTWDDPALREVWAALERSAVPVFLHPHYGVGIEEFSGFEHGLPVALGFPFETSLAVSRFVLAGGLQQFPDLRVILAHGGGTLPFLAGRLDSAWRSDESLVERLPVAPSTELTKLYLDALVYHPRALRACLDLVGPDHIAFGSDNPFSVSAPQRNIDTVREAVPDESQAAAIFHGTAAALFGLGVGPASSPA